MRISTRIYSLFSSRAFEKKNCCRDLYKIHKPKNYRNPRFLKITLLFNHVKLIKLFNHEFFSKCRIILLIHIGMVGLILLLLNLYIHPFDYIA
jgi:hypothetical protein